MDSKRLILALCLFALPAFLSAQEESAQTVPEQNAELNAIVQPFSWNNLGDVLKYEILIEKYDGQTGSYAECFYRETDEEETLACTVYIDPPLPPGNYRYTIRVYNILGGLEPSLTTVEEFTILRAYKPEVSSTSYPLTMSSTIYLDDLDNNGVIRLSGRNLFMPSEGLDADEGHTDYYMQNRQRIIRPAEIVSHDDRNNREITFRFDMKSLEVGTYNFVAMDASGLHNEFNSASAFTVKFKKAVDLDVSLDYIFPVVVHDATLPDYMASRVWPLSAQARVNFMFVKRAWGYMGAGLNVSATRMQNEQGAYSVDGNLFIAQLRFVYQLPLFQRRFMLEVHGGGGVTYFNNFVFHFAHNVESKPLNTLSLSFGAGLAGQFYINKRLFVEVGADYTITLNPDTTLGMVLPFAGVGWQF